MTRIISVSLSKGGVGKTTTATTLSHGLAITKRRTLLIDTDTQNQCAKALGVDSEVGLADFMLDNVAFNDAVITVRDNLDLMVGGSRLAILTNDIARETVRAEEVLKRKLMPHMSQYDYVIIDSSPSWDNLSVNLLFFADELLLPCNLDQPSLDGLIDFINRLDGFRDYRDINIQYVLPTALDKRVAMTGHIKDQLYQAFGNKVCEPIPYNSSLGYAYAYGQTIFEYEPKSSSAIAYSKLVGRIIGDE